MGLFEKKAGPKEDVHAPEVASPDPELVKEAVTDGFQESARKLEEARDGRNESDIPLNDAYWEIRNAHQLAHHKHIIRTDATQLVKGKPVDKSKLEEE